VHVYTLLAENPRSKAPEALSFGLGRFEGDGRNILVSVPVQAAVLEAGVGVGVGVEEVGVMDEVRVASRVVVQGRRGGEGSTSSHASDTSGNLCSTGSRTETSDVT
jgi:hypothetical protein